MSTPGLNGDYADTCAICLTPTDTALAFRGEPEWCIAILSHLDIPADQAMHMVANFYSNSEEEMPDQLTVPVRICSECTSNANIPDPGLVMVGHGIPLVQQPRDPQEG